MADPVTVTTILAIAASKFVETAANKAGELVAPAVLQRARSQVDKLWGRIAEQKFAQTRDSVEK